MPSQYPQTINGTWRARYASEFYDAQGRQWRVEFIDHDTTGAAALEFNLFNELGSTHHDVEVAGDGFNLSWDGPTDHVGGAIVPSSCEVTFIIDTALKEPLVDVIKSSDDNRFALAVYYDDGGQYWKPWWVGALNHEAIEYETKDRPYLVTLKASCGLRRLANIEFSDNGAAYIGNDSLLEVVAKCLNKLPTSDFHLSNTTQFSEVVDLFNEGHASTSVAWSPTATGDVYPFACLERTVVATTCFAERKEPREDDFGRRIRYPHDFNSCGDVLEHIFTALGGRFLQSRGQWWFVPLNAFNWSHTLNVVNYTQSQMASENLHTHMVGGFNIDKGGSTTVNFETDLEANHALGDGWSNSYLLPVKRASVALLNAGQRSAFGSPRSFYLDYPNSGGGHKQFANNVITVSEGDTINVRGRYLSGDLIKEFGATIGGGAFNTYGLDRIGARIVLRLKLKVGNLYYSSEYNVDNVNLTAIDMPLGFQGDFTDPNLTFKRVHVPDPVWTTEEKFFDVIIPWTHSTPEAPVEDDGNGFVRVGGLHIKDTGNNEFKYRVNETQQDDVAHEFDFMTVPLPNNSSSYTGMEITVDRIVLTREGAVRQTFPELDDIFQSVAIVDYDHTGTDIGSFTLSAPEDRVEELLVGVGNNSDDADIDFIVEQNTNTEFLDLGSTVLGDNVIGGVPQSDGALSVIEYGGPNIFSTFTQTGWRSITDGIDQADPASNVLIAMSREQLFMRGTVLGVQRGVIVPKVSTATNYTAPLDILTVLFHNCSTEADDRDDLILLTMTHNVGRATYEVDAYVRARTRLSFTEPPIGPQPATGGGGSDTGAGTGPNGGVNPSVVRGGSSTSTFENTTNEGVAAVKFTAATNTADIAPIKSFVGTVTTSPPTRGVELLTINTSGIMQRVADGTNGQALTTDGLGSLGFTTVGGSTPSVTPTGRLSGSSPYASGSSVTWTATNYDGFTTYIPEVKDRNGNVVTTTFTQNGAAVTFNVPTTAGDYSFNVKGATAGLGQSATLTIAFTVSAAGSYSYFRWCAVDSSGNKTAQRIALVDATMFDGAGLTGNEHPAGIATSNNSQTAGPVNFVISSGYNYSSTYEPWRAFDNRFNTTGSMWWSLSVPNAASNYIQIQFTDGAKSILSGSIIVAQNFTDATNIRLEGSTTGAFAGEEQTIHTFTNTTSGSGFVTHTF